MELQLIYQQNASAEKLWSFLDKIYDRITLDEIRINGLNHLLIKIPDSESKTRKSLNTLQAINNCLDEETLTEILKANNIYLINNEEGLIRSYEILICNLDILSIRLVYHDRKYKPKYLRESENRKLSELAKRIFLILGLDIGLIRLAYTTRRRLRVIGVEPSPILRERDLKRILNRIDEIRELDKLLPTINVKLGADPEFMIFNSKSNRLLSASRFFPRDGVVGCDNIRMASRQQRPVAEIRPNPSFCPLRLSNNIKQALDQANRMAPYQNIKWLAGSQPGGTYSIGGHIHFSNIQLTAHLIRALDNYLAIPIFLIEEPVPATRRRRRYGYLGDYRVKDYGGFEYRTPASWLVSQEITTAVLCLAKIIASSYYMLSKNFLNSVEAQKAFYSGNQDFLRPVFPELWADIKKTEMYFEYEEELKIIPELIFNNLTWNEKSDFRKAWKLKPTRRRPLRSSSDSSQRSSISQTRSPTATRVSPRSGSRRIRTSNSRSQTRVSATPTRGGNNPARSNNPRQGRIITSAQVRRTHIVR
ncbi:MAG TPA: hypothetical protein GXX58_00305 [Gelria sp.]|jgi:hypothetical protein|nr:hypothetical protein [Gelria sp.]